MLITSCPTTGSSCSWTSNPFIHFPPVSTPCHIKCFWSAVTWPLAAQKGGSHSKQCLMTWLLWFTYTELFFNGMWSHVTQVHTGCTGSADEVTWRAKRAWLAVTQRKTGLRWRHHCVRHPAGQPTVRDMSVWRWLTALTVRSRPCWERGRDREDTLHCREDLGLPSSSSLY